MKTDELLNTPIERVWSDTTPFLVWDKYSPGGNNLLELREGLVYHIKSSVKYILGDIQLDAWWNKVIWKEPIKFIPGKLVGISWWDYARTILFKYNLYPFLSKCGVKVVGEASAVSSAVTPGCMSYVIPDTISFSDVPYMPALSFPGGLLHESFHLWEIKNGYRPDGNGEIPAHSMNQLLHILEGDGVDVFKSYPGAIGLLL